MLIKHVLQWHITHKCNLRCLHCYQEDYNKDLSYDEIEKIFYDYLDFLKEKNYKGHINVTGGEPFLCPYFFKVLELFEENNITFGILTNGTLITEDIVDKLSKLKNLSFVQISLDGPKRMHDKIRGEGNYKKAINGIRLLNKYNIESMVVFTAHKRNYKKIKSVIRIVKKEKVKVFWSDRMIPVSTTEDILSTEEFLWFAKTIQKEALKSNNSVTEIRANRALMFLGGGDTIYHCSAGTTLLTILANGDLMPCRRLNVVIGNTLKDKIVKIYNNSDVIKYLVDNEIPKECNSCYKAKKCRGGLKCLSHAVYNELCRKDINCPIKNDNC